MKNHSSPFVQLVSVLVSFMVLACFLLFIQMVTPVSFKGKWKEVEIPEGSSYRKGISILKENDIIKGSLGLFLIGRLTDAETQLKPGYYSLSASMSPWQIFETLIEGSTIQYSITIPEGSSLKGIKRKFRKTGLISDEAWELVNDEYFLDLINVNAPSLEGYLYPDTYSFPKGTDPEIIFKRMLRRLREEFNTPLLARAEELGMTENEVLALASIIEKEAVFNRERPVISAVYHNRLKKNMRLQADPTVLYGVEKRWKRIRYRDLKRVTPYNTYKIKGLPPGPIASPGIESIKAALYPSDDEYLFFVAKNDGTHFFSKTDKEHWKAVVLFQRNGRKKNGNGKKKIN